MNTILPEHTMLAIAAALLDQGRSFDRLSRSVTVGALVTLIAIGIFGAAEPVLGFALTSSILVGLINLYFSVRVGVDAAIFHHFAAARDEPVDLKGLDDALKEMGLLAASKAGRPLNARIIGARRLLICQIYVTLLQVALFLLGAIYAVIM